MTHYDLLYIRSTQNQVFNMTQDFPSQQKKFTYLKKQIVHLFLKSCISVAEMVRCECAEISTYG